MERASRVLTRWRQTGAELAPEQLARAAYAVAVGTRLAGKSDRQILFGRKLVVDVEDAIWQRQMTGLRSLILDKMRDVLGRELVTEIEFRIAPPRMPVQSDAGPLFGVERQYVKPRKKEIA